MNTDKAVNILLSRKGLVLIAMLIFKEDVPEWVTSLISLVG